MAKSVSFNKEKIIKGIDTVADAAKITMGAKGQTVIINGGFLGLSETKDGANVVRSIFLEDQEENTGALLMHELVSNVADIAGDGTTCATVLTQALIKEGYKAISVGASPVDVRKGVDIALKKVVDNIEKNKKPVSSEQDILNVATISANGDAELGEMIAKAYDEIGKEGIITVEESKGTDTNIEVVKGMSFDKGFISPYLANDNTGKVCEYDNALILVTDKKINNLRAIIPVLEAVSQRGTPLVIIADDFDGETLSTLVLNHVKGGFKICAVKAPEHADHKKEVLGDIAVYTGASIVSDETGLGFDKLSLDHLGIASKVVINKDRTIIIGGKGEEQAIEERVAGIRSAIEESTSEYDRNKLKSRLGRLVGGVAVIHVGGMTEAEVKERKDRVDDSVAATRAAIEDGIVAGGGVTLFRASQELNPDEYDDDVRTGVKIVKNALIRPICQIAENAGVSGEVVVNELKALNAHDMGYDVCSNATCNMMAIGVIDSAKVVKTALKIAVSTAKTVLMSGCVITDKPTNEESKHPILK